MIRAPNSIIKQFMCNGIMSDAFADVRRELPEETPAARYWRYCCWNVLKKLIDEGHIDSDMSAEFLIELNKCLQMMVEEHEAGVQFLIEIENDGK